MKSAHFLGKYLQTKHSKNYIPEGMASKEVAFSYFCDECEHACQSKKSLNKHKAQHYEDHNHQCNICEKSFNYKKYLMLKRCIMKITKMCLFANTILYSILFYSIICDKCLNEDAYLY